MQGVLGPVVAAHDDAPLLAGHFEQDDLGVELAAIAVVLDGKLELGVEEHRAGIIVFQVGQFRKVGREADTDDESGLPRRVALEIPTEQGDSRPSDEGNRRVNPSRPSSSASGSLRSGR